jgi:PAS domain S-box-containing protein
MSHNDESDDKDQVRSSSFSEERIALLLDDDDIRNDEQNSDIENVREEERVFRKAIDAHSLVTIIDSEGVIRYVNERFHTSLGRSPIELIGAPLTKFLVSSCHDNVVHLIERIRSGVVGEGEFAYLRAPHEEFWVSATVVPYRGSTSHEQRAVVIQSDISALRRVMGELTRAKEVSETATLTKSLFLANMSHEIRTPLTSILGFTEALQSMPPPSESESTEALEAIRRNAHHLLGIINQILDLSKVESGKLELELLDTPIAGLLDEVMTTFRHAASVKGVVFSLTTEWGMPTSLVTDPLRCKQVLFNLCSNAVKFTPSGGKVDVHVRYLRDSNTLQCIVRDNGVGLSEAQSERIFKPFCQGDSSTTRKFGGTGLGLSISRELAQRLGGDITVESTEGRGSTFTFTLKSLSIDTLSLKQLAPLNRHEETPAIGGKILVVEDGKDNQRLLTLLLTRAGYQVTVKENGLEGVEEARRSVFDVILMDIQMPVMDGYDATALLRKNGFTNPIVALTANGYREDIEKCFHHGCTDYLGKPFERETLLRKVASSIKSVSTRSEGPSVEVPQRAPSYACEDRGAIHELLLEDPALKPIMRNFVLGLVERIESLEATIEECDNEKTKRLLHNFRGTAGNFGFAHLSTLAKNAESAIGVATFPDSHQALIQGIREVLGDGELLSLCG